MPRTRELATPAATEGQLREALFSKRAVPDIERWRTYYGRNVTPARIEQALRSAEQGWMRDLTDLATETVAVDPHLASVLQKRFSAIAACDWDVAPVQGEGVDKARATHYADVVRAQLAALPRLRQAIIDLAWGIFDGRAALEIHWRITPGRVRYEVADLAWIHPRRLCFGPERELRVADWNHVGLFYEVGTALRDVPHKFIAFSPRIFREYPEREGLAARCLYWSFFKRFSARHRMILTELFGGPWKILEIAPDASVSDDVLKDALDQLDALGAGRAARLPKGTKLSLPWPNPKAGEIYSATIEDCNRELSKLVLGNTGTTDAEANRAESVVHKGEQNIFLQADGWSISEVIDGQLVDAIVELNFGAAALPMAPQFQIRTSPPKDRRAELERLRMLVDMGAPVALAEAYEVTGFRVPADDERIIRLLDVGPAGEARPRVVDPAEERKRREQDDRESTVEALVAPQIPLTPSDLATIVTVNEGRLSAGLGPLLTPSGAHDPDGDMSITAYKAKYAETLGAAAAAEQGKTGPTDPSVLPPAPGVAQPPPAPPPPPEGAENEEDGGDDAAEEEARQLEGKARHAAAQPSTVHGSPETLIARGVRDGVRETERWTARIASAVEGVTDPLELHRVIERAGAGVDVGRLARAVEMRTVHAAMLGALDADWEATNEDVVAPVRFEGQENFATKPFAQAIAFFRSKRILSKTAFERLTTAAKRRAFTVAGMARRSMVETAHAELARAIEDGADLRTFRGRLEERFASAGWRGPGPSHVEVVFRNAAMGSYAHGRHTQMSQPEVLAARPYWQIMGVRDDRTRDSHRMAIGKVLRADDAFWERAPLPWGHNCRCRKVSRSARDLERLGLRVTGGAELVGLPDEGWDVSALATDAEARMLGYNPDQPRDDAGRFGDGGGAAGAEKQQKRLLPKVEVREASAEEFREAFERAFPPGAPYEHHVSHYSVAELREMKCLLAEDGKTGIAIKDHGDGRIEGTALFNQGGQPGAGPAVLVHAVRSEGVNYVECYSGHLDGLYRYLGFETVETFPFDPTQAAKGWNYERFGSPDYHLMRYKKT